MKKPQRLERTTIYESPWVNLYADKVKFPDGRIIDEHHVLEFNRESVVVIVENDRDEILMIEAYRYPVDLIDLELPAGLIDEGESILEAAERETLEETGFTSTAHRLIYSYHPLIGVANKVHHIVRCRALEESGTFDRNEVRQYRWFSCDEIRELFQKKVFTCGYTMLALMLVMNDLAE